MESPVLLVIIGCEIGFWVVVFAGLAVRYGLRAPRASTIILRMVPVVDVVLLVAVAATVSAAPPLASSSR